MGEDKKAPTGCGGGRGLSGQLQTPADFQTFTGKEGGIMARKKVVSELSLILQKIPEDKQYIAQKLIDELIFMQETLTTLKRQIKTEGTQEEFVQGKQNFMRESPALTSYTKLIARYGALYKQLCDLLPKTVEADKSNGLYDWLKGGSE